MSLSGLEMFKTELALAYIFPLDDTTDQNNSFGDVSLMDSEVGTEKSGLIDNKNKLFRSLESIQGPLWVVHE